MFDFGGMTLGRALKVLGDEHPNKIVKLGFNTPHSWRGSYEELGVEPAKNVSVGSMVAVLSQALGSTYTGYKGGEYTMNKHSEVHLAHWGDLGEPLTEELLDNMLKDVVE